jgi:hypothetical protein
MKYIEKDKAYKIVLHYGSYAASAKIADLPSIDLVRCKECKHYNAGFECLVEGYGVERDPDWFCADGERSEA